MSRMRWVCRYTNPGFGEWNEVESDSAYEAAIRFCENNGEAGEVEVRELGPTFKLMVEKRVAFAVKKS